nr:MAG TPA: hypothetical protein [Caudoviricetes sp.]
MLLNDFCFILYFCLLFKEICYYSRFPFFCFNEIIFLYFLFR